MTPDEEENIEQGGDLPIGGERMTTEKEKITFWTTQEVKDRARVGNKWVKAEALDLLRSRLKKEFAKHNINCYEKDLEVDDIIDEVFSGVEAER